MSYNCERADGVAQLGQCRQRRQRLLYLGISERRRACRRCSVQPYSATQNNARQITQVSDTLSGEN